MITEITTAKGFKVLKLNKMVDAVKLFKGGLSICDSCNAASSGGYYIAVLNMFYCEECYNEWHEEAIYYPEDAAFEQRYFEHYRKEAEVLNNLQKRVM